MLVRLVTQAGQAAGDGTTIDFPLTRKDVAAMCGATLHAASRILTAWEKAELITTRRQHVTLQKLADIRRIAEDPPR